jgi:hypothetical protein
MLNGATGNFASFPIFQTLEELTIKGFTVDPIWLRLPHLQTLTLDGEIQIPHIPEYIKQLGITALTVHNEPFLLFNWASTETKDLAFCKRFTRLISKCNQLKSLYIYHDWVDILEGYDERPKSASYEVLIHRIAPHVPMLEQLTIGIQYFDPSRLEEACKVVKPLRTLNDIPHLTHISASAHALLNPSLATGSPTTMTAFPEGLQHSYIHHPGQEVLRLLADLQENSARLRRLKTLTLQYWKGDPMDPPTLYLSPERAAILQLGTSAFVRWADYNDDPQWFMHKRR